MGRAPATKTPTLICILKILGFCFFTDETTEMDLSPLVDPQRLRVLRETALMDSLPEPVFDRFVRLAARITDAPTALVSLVDERRQFFKAQTGLHEPWSSRRETPLTHSFCKFVVASGEPLVVESAREHPWVKDNLAITDIGVEAYLGAPLELGGEYLGALCVIDGKPRQWSEEDQQAMRDLADAVNTELALRQRNNELAAERDAARLAAEAWSDFLGRAGHELRTPLQGILLSTEMVASDPALEGGARRMVEAALSSAQAMRKLLDDILYLHRLNRGLQETQHDDVSLTERFRWLEAELHVPGRSIAFVADGSLDSVVRLDWGKVHRILVHLVSNAVKFTPGDVSVKARRERDLLVVEVQDQGPGLTEAQERIAFEPFGRLRHDGEGSGLGLSLARRLAVAIDGKLELDRSCAQGCRFQLSLPYEAPPESQVSASALSAALPRQQVLVVDDHQLNLELFEALFTSLGQTVTTANSGIKALEILDKQEFDLVLMDLQMPGLSGYETLAKLTRRPGQRVVGMSAGTVGEATRVAKEAGFDDFLPKPVSRQDLMRVLMG